uniref:Ig-like domain-containing protein n=1 Tax=Oreochromis aureus TaxID=47969 RepID=A0AAZ1XJR2_OREAU
MSPSGLIKAVGVLPDGPLYAAVGETVMFTTTLTPTETPFQSVIWTFDDSKNIITSSTANITGPEYEGRIILFPSTGSLELRSLTLNDSASYSVIIFPAGATKISASSVKPSTNLPVEGTSVNLTCEASGSVLTRKWMKDGSDLTPTDNMTLSDNNRVLTFDTVTRKDSGEYFCQISNPISSDGAKYVMTVNYGPENVQIKGPNKINIKGTLKLTCSAESTPSARFTWFLNGTEVLTNSAEYIKEEVGFSDSANYICQAWNNITERTSSSVVQGLTVTGMCVFNIVWREIKLTALESAQKGRKHKARTRRQIRISELSAFSPDRVRAVVVPKSDCLPESDCRPRERAQPLKAAAPVG